ncbi:MAG TPA: hypothetical protein VD902_18265, partial [Symbiobacteriaceae bacterium]|nr:hypothetical protein [Symbiobacteriaceae bacterium]
MRFGLRARIQTAFLVMFLLVGIVTYMGSRSMQLIEGEYRLVIDQADAVMIESRRMEASVKGIGLSITGFASTRNNIYRTQFDEWRKVGDE